MQNKDKLTLVKSIHTLIWAIFVLAIDYVLWSGITGKVSVFSWLAAGMVVISKDWF